MASAENQQHTLPAAPPSTSAGDHEMHDYYAAQDASRPTLNQPPYLTPYLGLRARLSQVWINRWTVLLLLVLIRTLFAIASLDTNLASARRQALSACTSVENVGSAMASMPYYMSQGVNELSAHGIEKAINGLMQMLLLSVTGTEEIVVFIINLLTSTYVCLITFAVGGGLHVAIDVAEDVGNLLNSTAKDVGSDLASIADTFQTAMSKFIDGIDDIGSALSGHTITPPSLDLNDTIAKLNSLQLPIGYDQGLSKLNGSIPTFAEVNNFTNNAIKLPFEDVKRLLNESMGTYTMNRSLFPVPQKEHLTFCSTDNGVDDFFDDLVHIEQLAKKIFLVVIIIAAVLCCIPMAYREIRRWRFMNERAQYVKRTQDPMDAVYLVSRPYTSSAGMWIADRLSSSRRRTLVRWTVAYATTAPALFVLSLAIAGLLGCLCQYILLKAIQKEVPALENEISAFADKVVASLNNASMQWAVGTNELINKTNTKINDDVLGWVNTTTGALNGTLNVFVDGMMDALNITFGDTVLYEPVLEVLNCLVLLKVQGIEKALTWVSDNAYIDFPLLPNDTFSLGTLDKIGSESTDNSVLATASQSNATDEISSAVEEVIKVIAKAIRQEAIISTCVLLVWVVILFVGLFRSGFLLLHHSEDEVVNRNQKSTIGIEKEESHALDGFFPNQHETAKVPTYEQATKQFANGNTANKYNGQEYTLSPRRFPTFEFTGAPSPILSSGFSPNEKVGFVGGHNVEAATRRPAHIRASSYGNFALTSPIEHHQQQPQSNDGKSTFLQSPSADHTR
ncbi:hypothetical protein MBLNU459_g8119t1 [Dothideomycetes sp. NU459]